MSLKKLKFLFFILLPLAIILLNFTIFLHSLQENAPEIARNVVSYLTKDSDLITEHYTEQEISHLADVQNLTTSLHIVLYLSLVIMLIISLKTSVSKEIFKGSILTIIIIILLALLNFDWLFTKFHLISFSNYNWLLPQNSTLIQLFPQSFFFNAFRVIIMRSFITSLILIALVRFKNPLSLRIKQ